MYSFFYKLKTTSSYLNRVNEISAAVVSVYEYYFGNEAPLFCYVNKFFRRIAFFFILFFFSLPPPLFGNFANNKGTIPFVTAKCSQFRIFCSS